MSITFKPLTETFGAEVIGYNPRRDNDEATGELLRKAFDQYDILLMRDLELDEEEQAKFAGIFGRPAPQTVVPPGVPKPPVSATMYVSNTRSDGIIPNGDMIYHMDNIFDEEPVRILMLYGVEVPKAGGGTKFRSCVDIYDTLSAEMKAKAEKISCQYLFDPFNPNIVREPGKPAPWDEDREDGRSVFSIEDASPHALKAWHPMIYTNPRSKRKAAWAMRAAVDFKGVGKEEGYSMLDQMWQQSTQLPEYVHNWQKGDLLMWNNLMLHHGRTPFQPTEKRTLRRSQLL